MRLRRLATALFTTAALAAICAPRAQGDIGFIVMPGYAGVELDDDDATTLDLVRGGVVIASSDEGMVSVDELKAGDVARAYVGRSLVGSATYDGTPVIADACIGSATFTATRAPSAVIDTAGAFISNVLEPLTGTWDLGIPVHVKLDRALADGDVAMVTTSQDDLDPPAFSTRLEPAVACSPHTPVQAAPGGTPVTGRQPGAQPPTAAPKATVESAVRSAGTALAHSKLANRTRLSLPFTFPEAGTAELRVLAHGRTIARGSRTAGGTANVTLKLSSAGRRLLQRTPRLKVTLKATFTPSRAGATPQRASVTMTIKGSSSRA